jgi:hypothetical protein
MRAAMRATNARIQEMGSLGRARVLKNHDVRTSARLLARLLGDPMDPGPSSLETSLRH